MNLLTTFLLALSCTLGTSQDDGTKQAQQRFFIFDVQGSPTNLSQAFQGLDVVYKFKVTGGRRFLIVTRNTAETQEVMYNFAAPPNTEVSVIPAELFGDYARSLGVTEINDTQLISIQDDDLLLVEFTIFGAGSSRDQYTQQMKTMVQMYTDPENQSPVRVFHHTATYPYKAFVFFSVLDYELDRMYLWGSDAYKGPDQMQTKPFRIFNIKDSDW